MAIQTWLLSKKLILYGNVDIGQCSQHQIFLMWIKKDPIAIGNIKNTNQA